MTKYSILLFFLCLSLFYGCEEEIVIHDFCPGCSAKAKLNSIDWVLTPYYSEFVHSKDSSNRLFYIDFFSSSAHDDFDDVLVFRNIPFKNGSIIFPTSFGYTGPNVFFDVYESGYDVQIDSYEIVPGSESFIKVEIPDQEKDSFRLSFNLVLSVDGDTTKQIRNHSYPSVLHITEGIIEGNIYK